MSFLRKVSLLLVQGEKALDLSDMHIKFRVQQQDEASPNNALIRVYNLSDQTSRSTQEFCRVVLQAGYDDEGMGVIFDGTVTAYRRGRENALDSFLEIQAADGDLFHNFCIVQKTLAKGSTMGDVLDAIEKSPNGALVGYSDVAPQTASIRGKVLFMMGCDVLHNVAKTYGTTWSIQNGQIQIIKTDGYLPNEAVKLNATTGMIGAPEQTVDGINVRALLSSKYIVGGLLQIDNKDITQLQYTAANTYAVPFNRYTGTEVMMPTTDDGYYRIYSAEHNGDNRGHEWYTDLVGLTVVKDQDKVKYGA